MDDFRSLVISNRSCRRFDGSAALATETLEGLVDLARHTASAANKQPLKYVLSTRPDKNQEIYDCLGWAAYLTDWKGPVKAERPTGYGGYPCCGQVLVRPRHCRPDHSSGGQGPGPCRLHVRRHQHQTAQSSPGHCRPP